MRCAVLRELPPPPSNKRGFPWTEETKRDLSDVSNLPTITIVTPSYNQGQFLEETIRSVLLQGYPKLEYIIIDGGSTDNSVEIILKYKKWLTYWESKPDFGQSDAINKGISKSKGKWVNWLNSDDLLQPNALMNVAFQVQRTSGSINGLIFACNIISSDGFLIRDVWRPKAPRTVRDFFDPQRYPVIPQPSTFIRRDKFRINQAHHYIMDWAFYIQLEDCFPGSFKAIDYPTSAFRVQPESKTSVDPESFLEEAIDFINSYNFLTHSTSELAQKYVRLAKSHKEISEILTYNDKKKSFVQLLGMLHDSPYLLVDRMFLGALKKCLLI